MNGKILKKCLVKVGLLRCISVEKGTSAITPALIKITQIIAYSL